MKLSIFTAALFSSAVLFAPLNTVSAWNIDNQCDATKPVGLPNPSHEHFTSICPGFSHLIKLKVDFWWIFVSKIRGKCSDGTWIESPAVGLSGSGPAQRRLLADSTEIDSDEGFSELDVWQGSGAPPASLTTQVASMRTKGKDDKTLVPKPTSGVCGFGYGSKKTSTYGIPIKCVCPPGTLIAGFQGTAGGYCSKIQFLCCKPGVHGDPQFVGFMGQSFQVHGMDNTVYNVISTPQLQFNALFTYLNKGECREGTLCFSHPGNYFGKVGVSIKAHDKVHQLLIEAGPVKEGMKVTIDGARVIPSEKRLQIDENTNIYYPNAFDCYVETPEFSLKFENSDMFINQQLTVNNQLMNKIKQYKSAVAQVNSADNTSEVALTELPHGILGQTWQFKEYQNRWKYIEGQLYDYIVADGLNGNKFKFNRFNGNAAASVEITQP